MFVANKNIIWMCKVIQGPMTSRYLNMQEGRNLPANNCPSNRTQHSEMHM